MATDNTGRYLDEHFDFDVTNTRDIQTDEGVTKLASDLSYLLSSELDEYVGGLTNQEVKTDMIADARRVILSHGDVRGIVEAKNVPTSDRGEIKVKYTIVSSFGQFSNIETITE